MIPRPARSLRSVRGWRADSAHTTRASGTTRAGEPARVSLLCLLAAFHLAAFALAACGPDPAAPPPNPTNPIDAVTRGPVLEVRLVPVPSDPVRIARVLAAVDDPRRGMTPARARLWRENGLRVLLVPADRVDDLIADLGPRTLTESRLLPPTALWTPAASGPNLPPMLIELDAGNLRLPRGSLRLLARPWVEPIIERSVGSASANAPARAGSRMRIGLLLQHLADDPLEAQRRLLQPGDIGPLDDGQLFDRLLADAAIPRGHALIIVPEAPGVDWTEIARRADEQDAAADEAAGEEQTPTETNEAEAGQSGGDERTPDPPADPPAPFGPLEARAPTLGEALLGPTGYASGSTTPTRLILVLVPRLADPDPGSRGR